MAKVLYATVVLHLLYLKGSLLHAQELDNPIVTVPMSWPIIAPMRNITFPDGSQARPILVRVNPSGSGMAFVCGFLCRGNCRTFLFAVFMVYTDIAGRIIRSAVSIPQMVWTANRAHPVKENGILELNTMGELVLFDADGTRVWSSHTTGKLVSGVNMTESGNLVLFGGGNNQTVLWESFSSPTDCLVPGQKLRLGQKLTASVSSDNSSEGQYLLVADSIGLVAFVNTNPPQQYALKSLPSNGFFEFWNGSLSGNTSEQNQPSSQYLRLESDGGLRAYQWTSTQGWTADGADLLNANGSPCFSPTVCGRYGICSGKDQCVCPSAPYGDNFFRLVDDQDPSIGCRELVPFSCSGPNNPTLLRLDNVSYFAVDYSPVDLYNVDHRDCSEACARNCSCRAAFFRYKNNASDGQCFIMSEIFSLKNRQSMWSNYNSIAFIKVQFSPQLSLSTGLGDAAIGIFVSASFASILVLCGGGILIEKKRAAAARRKKNEDEEDDDLQQVSGMPRRFSLKVLRASTEDFSKKLGQGGFGSVFEGRIDGQMVAVKRLDSIAQGKKQFLAEVQTIGKLHHFNLVKLVGYCAARSDKLLVYEFMPNSSLENWIFPREKSASLEWKTRRKIILGIAKALAYLHEDCAEKIAHLDIKPQNILLDEGFEPKVSDFGLAKLIDREQTHVETRMRGTPGYLAPEWLSSMITEKADVYSFGVVVLEIVSGRKHFDLSLPEDEALLVGLAATKAQDGELGALIDRSLDCTEEDSEEATRILQVGLLCLLHDHKRRPSMSAVVKLLEGTVPVEYYEDGSPGGLHPQVHCDGSETSGSAPLLASVLSGPR